MKRKSNDCEQKNYQAFSAPSSNMHVAEERQQKKPEEKAPQPRPKKDRANFTHQKTTRPTLGCSCVPSHGDRWSRSTIVPVMRATGSHIGWWHHDWIGMRHFESGRRCQFFPYIYKRTLPYFVDFDDDSTDVRASGLE